MHCFRIDAIADPQTLPRIAGFFAQRAIVPDRVAMRAGQDRITIEVRVAGLEADGAACIAAKLGESYAVLGIAIEDGDSAGRIPIMFRAETATDYDDRKS